MMLIRKMETKRRRKMNMVHTRRKMNMVHTRRKMNMVHTRRKMNMVHTRAWSMLSVMLSHMHLWNPQSYSLEKQTQKCKDVGYRGPDTRTNLDTL